MEHSKNRQTNHNLLAKSDIAKALGMSSQAFANRQSRDAEFPQPTYSNRAGTVALYTIEDAQKVYEHVTKAERERLANAARMFENLSNESTAAGL
ncbi:hypothetical protein [Arthrobacter sp. zg-Y895]|uniref:hypothetical protein n=1 Tax=Arthrobacter sp. zg-Y895 TaxID=2886933 RepID=UPI001D135BC0|nr:hypothetical protein [Arthrobacter sp. zg-Y895]MCC3302161.1 hypothetical protein [Arthrobacter sp. zg-Y895]